MHPSLSLIFFTTASGAGYGLLGILGIAYFFRLVPQDPAFGFSAIGTALALITAGLLSSGFHLGHPERAWRALSQWRSSWLSREAVLAILTYIPLTVFAIGWLALRSDNTIVTISGLAMSLLCFVTVYSTSMIYASLSTVHAWCHYWVPLSYLSLALMTGLILVNTLLLIHGYSVPSISTACLVSIAMACAIKLAYWRFIKQTRSNSTAESATGLGLPDKVRLLQSPHSQKNYLLKEMGFRVARKHAEKLRRLSLLSGFVLPFILTLTAAGTPPLPAVASAVFAVIFSAMGVIIERWLFFAEARHTVMLYYGNASA